MQNFLNPKFREELETILGKEFGDDEPSHILDKAEQLKRLAFEVEKPTGDTALIISAFLEAASKYLDPLAIGYIGFMFGVAWERSENANRA